MNNHQQGQKPRLRGGKVRPVRQNYTGLIVSVLILLLLAALLLVSAALHYQRANPKNPSNEENPPISGENSGTATSGSLSSEDATSQKPDPEGAIQYLTMTEEDLKKGNLILVNRDNTYDAALAAGTTTTVRDGRLTDIQENKFQLPIGETILTALETMQTGMKTAMADQVRLLVNAGYRTNADQQDLVDYYTDLYGEDYVKQYVAEPGKSEHHTELAADISFYDLSKNAVYATTSTEAAAHYSWLLNNCGNYGLILRYTAEKAAITGYSAESWHFRYVGIPHALYMNQNNLALEEYLTALQEYSFGKRLTVEHGDTTYEIYYVAAEESGTTTVPVPKQGNYTVSGDNHSGFIVTVEITPDA